MTDIDENEIALADLLAGGLEREFAEVMSFTMTSMLKLYKRQELLLEEMESLKPGLREKIDAVEGGPALGRAAAKLVEIIAECVDESAPEDSMLMQAGGQLMQVMEREQ